MIDSQNFSRLPLADKRAVWRMAKLRYNWAPDLVFPEVDSFEAAQQLYAEAREYRRARGWFDFGEVNDPEATEEYTEGSTEEYD